MREKIVLKKEMETLLIPLYGRAKMTEQGLLDDPYACETMQAIEYDFDHLRIPKKLQIFMAIRSSIFDDYTKQFLHDNPSATVLSLGSGLDARYARVDGYKKWVDLDFPQVIELREKLLPPLVNHQSIASSVSDWSWLDEVNDSPEKTLVVAEGLLMYLSEEEVFTLFDRLISKFPHTTFIFDAYSRATVKRITGQASLQKTGAEIRWGFDKPSDLTALNPRMEYVKTIYLTDEKYLARLNPLYRFLFRLGGRFSTAREAHRICIYRAI